MSVTVAGGGSSTVISYGSSDVAPFANTLSLALSAGLASGALTPVTYTSGAVAPGLPGGVVFFNTAPTTVVTIPTDDIGIVLEAGPASITGGGVGESVVAGSGGLTYTGITPSGSTVDYIVAGDGANLITTATTGTGNYQIETGSGSDTISVFGNGVVNAGGGVNSVSVSGGSSMIYSEGQDNITANGSGTDTVSIGTGQATINPGSANLLVIGSNSTKPLFMGQGTGTDTVLAGIGGGTVYGGSGGNNVLISGAGTVGGGTATTELHAGGSGDQLYATGSGPTVLFGGAGNEILSGAGGVVAGVTLTASTADDIFWAGTGNDTITGGAGSDTVHFTGLRADYSLTAGPGDTLVVTGIADGISTVDTLSGIETLAFADEIQPACFAEGTRILTTAGEVAVEALRVGDVVVTGGAPQAIQWIGRRRVDCHRHPEPHDVLPVRVAAHAFGAGCPHRDLFLSPDHAIFAEKVLIPVKHLINGTTVHRIAAESLTYYHLELARHDVVMAEGLACESYLETGARHAFANGGGATMLHPDFDRQADTILLWESLSYAPLVVAGPAVERARRGLEARECAMAEVAA